MKKIIIIILVIAVLGVAWAFIRGPEDVWLCVGDEWVKHGYPNAPKPTEPCGKKGGLIGGESVLKSEDSRGSAMAELIVVETPQPNVLVSSPLEIKGKARGFWFFEADFPVKLLDENSKEIGVAIARAEGEWMTEDFVPFWAVLEFSAGSSATGTLVLIKDNPSGLPENAGQITIPVRFQEP